MKTLLVRHSSLLILALLASSVSLFAAEKKGAAAEKKEDGPRMTKIVARMITHGPTGDVMAKPKTLYRAAKTYARIEEEPDADANVHRLIITSEPDSWVINLLDRTGRRYIDEGPEFETKVPIFWGLDQKPDKDFEALEFAQEMEFFSKDRARDSGMRKLDGKNYKTRSIKTGDHEAILFLDAKSDRPYQIDLHKYGRLTSSVRYVAYEMNLRFDKVLFRPPDGITITDEKTL